MDNKELFFELIESPTLYEDAVITSMLFSDEYAFIKHASLSEDVGGYIKDWLSTVWQDISKLSIKDPMGIVDFMSEGVLWALIPGGWIAKTAISSLFSASGIKVSDVLSKAGALLKSVISSGKQLSEVDVAKIAEDAVAAGTTAVEGASAAAAAATTASLKDAAMFKIAFIDLRNYMEANGLSSSNDIVKNGGVGSFVASVASKLAGKGLFVRILKFIMVALLAKIGLMAGRTAVQTAIKPKENQVQIQEQGEGERQRTQTSPAPVKSKYKENDGSMIARQNSQFPNADTRTIQDEFFEWAQDIYDGIPDSAKAKFMANTNVTNYIEQLKKYVQGNVVMPQVMNKALVTKKNVIDVIVNQI